MLGSLSRKMFILSTTTLVLTLFIVVSFSKINEQQKLTKLELEHIIEFQLCVDLLRSQLWVFNQYGDGPSLSQVEYAQAELATKLTAFKLSNIQLDNMLRMNNSLHTLVLQEKALFLQASVKNQSLKAVGVDSRGLIHSRYNMIVQNMTEELAHVHRLVLNRNSAMLGRIMSTAAMWLILSSILVSVVAWLILFRFRAGAEAIKGAIVDLAEGNLGSKVEAVKMDNEFSVIANFFNQMTVSLRDSTVTKQELQQELARQTKQLKHKQEQLLFLSEHDPLTDLANRRAFDKQLQLSIVRARRAGHKLAVLFIDLDDFKTINDSFGHDAGDYVLVKIAERLKDCVRESDIVGRLGGDEFVVCLDLLKDLDGVPCKIDQIGEVIKAPIEHNGYNVSVGASIGIACYPDQAENKDELVAIADKAMYVQKEFKDVAHEKKQQEPDNEEKNVIELFSQGNDSSRIV